MAGIKLALYTYVDTRILCFPMFCRQECRQFNQPKRDVEIGQGLPMDNIVHM